MFGRSLVLNILMIFGAMHLIDGMELRNAQNAYFPFDEDGRVGLSRYQIRAYSSDLKAMRKKSFLAHAGNSEKTAYRLTIFSENDTVCVELFNNNESWFITYTRIMLDGRNERALVTANLVAPIACEKVKNFAKIFDDLGFYSLHSADRGRGLGGSDWLMEAVIDGNYHVVVRWSPEWDAINRDTARFKKVACWLLDNAPSP